DRGGPAPRAAHPRVRPAGVAGAPAHADRGDGRQPRQRRAPPRGPRPARPRDRGPARPRDPRARARARGARGARHRRLRGARSPVARVPLMPLLHAVAAFAAAVSGHVAADVHHYEYVFPDEHIVVYDIDHGHRQIEDDDLPGITGIRGVAVDPASHALYLSHGGDGGGAGNGSLLRYDLVSKRVVWDRDYPNGIDSMAVSPDGSRIYMPTGE